MFLISTGYFISILIIDTLELITLKYVNTYYKLQL